jgi:DNA (cytosine-5)-methyltransferase 1
MNPHYGFLNSIRDDGIFQNLKNMKDIRIGTDCSGIDAPIMSLDILGINYTHVFSSDNNQYIKQNILANYSPEVWYDNVFDRNLNQIPDINCYVAGFPCQSFSSGGGREGFYKNNNEGLIFFACMDVIDVKKPIFFILENVKGLLTHDEGETFKIMMEVLNQSKIYNIYYKLLKTSDFDLPHIRERVYIVGIRKDYEKRMFKFPMPIKRTVSLEDILTDHTEYKDQLLSYAKQDIVDRKTEKLNIQINENWTVNLNCSYGYATAKLDNVPTLLTTCNMVYLTKYNRFLTTRECLRLQGFSDDFELVPHKNKAYKAIGNSMSTNILCFLFLEIFRSILPD